jgi:phosphoadenosine phosphosulfate reductase
MPPKNNQQRLFKQLSIQSLEEEAISFIVQKCSASSNIGLGFSGGKDSVVIMELMKRTGLDFTAFYHATQIDPPEIVRFIRAHHPEVRFFYPKHKFFKKIVQYAPPLPTARWCCAVLKHDSSPESKQFYPLILGIRAEESKRRRNYSRVDSWKKHQTYLYPILKWTELDVWEYIEWRNLTYCSLYDEGFDRLGCVCCPFKSPHVHEISKKKWPGIYRAFENSVKKWFYKKQSEGRDLAYDTPEAFLEDWYKHKARWYRGKRAKNQPK